MTHPLTRPASSAASPTWAFDPDLVPTERRDLVPRYGDDTWSLLALTQNPSVSNDRIKWSWFPQPLREAFRHTAWAMLNHPVSDEWIVRHGAPMRARLSVGRMFKTVHQWAMLAQWLDGRGIFRLSEVGEADFADFSRYLGKERGATRNTVSAHLVALSRLTHFSQRFLPESDQMTEPPWLSQGMDDYLPAASPRGENLTEPITPATMGPLLVWALRFVEEFAGDILTAHEEHRRLISVSLAARRPVRADDTARLAAFLENLVAVGESLPVFIGSKGPQIAGRFLSGTLDIPIGKFHSTLGKPHWQAYASANPGPCLLDVPVTARLGGRPWHDPFEFDGVRSLLKHLVTACFIVMAYLTGMRPGEILGLAAGCCPDPEGAEGDAATRHLVFGREFKSARDEDGNHDSAGVVREAPWIAVPQVVTAIRVLERFTGEDRLLFAAEAHDPRTPRIRCGRSLSLPTMNNRVESFVDWVNTYAEQRGREAEMIPADLHGRIGIARFRRTLAWHIARRPGGLVALAVQYGHMRTVISEGYAARSRGGIHDLLDFETARSVAEHLSDVHEALEEGEGVSGPAARRLIHAAAQEHHRFGGTVATIRQARALLADPTLNVFENKQAYLICNYDRAKALCHPGRGTAGDAPGLDRCRPNCANVARTDTHAAGLRGQAARLRTQAASPLAPEPVADRLRERAAALDALADRHDSDRITTTTDNDEVRR